MALLRGLAGLQGQEQDEMQLPGSANDGEATIDQLNNLARPMPQGQRSFSNGQEASEAAAIFRQVSLRF